MTLKLIKQFTGLIFNITDFVDDVEKKEDSSNKDQSEQSQYEPDDDEVNEDELDAEFEEEKKEIKKKLRKDSDMDEDGSSSEMEFPQKRDGQEDQIKNELDKVKPRLAVFRCVGIGLKNNSREMA